MWGSFICDIIGWAAQCVWCKLPFISLFVYVCRWFNFHIILTSPIIKIYMISIMSGAFNTIIYLIVLHRGTFDQTSEGRYSLSFFCAGRIQQWCMKVVSLVL